MKRFLFFIGFVSSICCHAQNNKPEIIQLVNSSSYGHELKLSDIAKQITYIPLETKDNCLIGNRYDVYLSKEFIFVNSGGIIFQFTSKGKFIRQVNVNGQGPGEGSAYSMTIDEDSQMIYIRLLNSRGILVFNTEGKYIRTITEPFRKGPYGSTIISFYKGHLLFPFTNDDGQNPYKYAIVDTKGEVIHSEVNYEKVFVKMNIMILIMNKIPQFHFNNLSCFFKQEYNDTIFRIKDDFRGVPEYILKLDKQLTREDVMKSYATSPPRTNEISGKNEILGVAASDTYLDIYHTYRAYDKDNKKRFFSRYNKQTRQLLQNVNLQIVNDWDGGMDVKMEYGYQQGSVFCFPIQPFEMKEVLTNTHFSKAQAKFPEQKEALKTLVNNLIEDDNPVLMLIHLK